MLTFAFALLLLQTPGPTPGRPPAPPASIEGMVTGPSGEPLSKATVTVSGLLEPLSSQVNSQTGGIIVVSSPDQVLNSGIGVPQQSSATTGRDGKFTIENLKPGSYLMDAERTGYVS